MESRRPSFPAIVPATFSNCRMVLPLSGPLAIRLDWSSRSLSIQASPIGPSRGAAAQRAVLPAAGRPRAGTGRSAQNAADKAAIRLILGQLKWAGREASCESRAASPSRRKSSTFLLSDRSCRPNSLSDHQVSTDPRFGLLDFAAVEESDRGGGKWLAEYRHAVFPRLLANQSEAFDVPEVFQIELDDRQRAPPAQPWKSCI